MMPIAAAVLLIIAQAGSIAIEVPAPPGDVVVTGTRFADALAKCLARNCPPAEDVEASMDAGAEHFFAGRYEDAKKTLQRSVARNKRFAAQLPGPVSDLYATYADVSQHEGDQSAYRLATGESVAVLRKYVGENDPRTLIASRRIGDMLAALDSPTAADQAYAAAAARAAGSGQHRLAGVLTFRRAWLADQQGQTATAKRLIGRADALAKNDEDVRRLTDGLRARMALAAGDKTAADAALGSLRSAPGSEQTIVHAPAYPALGPGRMAIQRNLNDEVRGPNRTGLDDFGGIRWADVGFWVRPDGRVTEAEILRSSEPKEWAKPILGQVLARRYTPATTASDSPGSYRLERFTLRPARGLQTGTHIADRIGDATLQRVDLTFRKPAGGS